MHAKRYRLVGYLAWRGSGWYLRRLYRHRLPSRRAAAVAGGGALALTGAALALARRAHS